MHVIYQLALFSRLYALTSQAQPCSHLVSPYIVEGIIMKECHADRM